MSGCAPLSGSGSASIKTKARYFYAQFHRIATPRGRTKAAIAVSESRTGAVADRSGAVHAFGCRRCGPETVPRFQPPLINPCTTFSITRLSEVLHRVAVGVAMFHLTVPDRVYTPNFWKYAAS